MLALQQLTDLGVKPYSLTSGQRLSAELGLPLLKELRGQQRAGDYGWCRCAAGEYSEVP